MSEASVALIVLTVCLLAVAWFFRPPADKPVSDDAQRNEIAEAIKRVFSYAASREWGRNNTARIAADAVLPLVRMAEERARAAERSRIDPMSPNWIDGWRTRDAENGAVQQEARAEERDRIRNAINETPGAVRKWCLKETGNGHPGSWLAWQDVLNLLDAVGSGDAE